MKICKLIALLLIGTYVLAGVKTLNGQNSTGWRGEHGNGIVEGFNTPDKWPGELNKDWQIKVGEGDASPVLINKKLYAFVKADNSETVVCLDASSGKKLWSTNH